MSDTEHGDNRSDRKRSLSADGDRDQDDDRPRKRRYNDEGTSRQEIRLLVQSHEAGTIIGKGGDNIKRLRTAYTASVHVSDNRGPERIATITGDLEILHELLEDILKLFIDKQRGDRGNRREEVELRMMVHQSQAGCVIGKAGSKLKQLRSDHNIDVKVFPSCCPSSTDRLVRVIGAPNNVSTCIVAIVDLLRTWPPKGPQRPYDPLNHSPSEVQEYGGYLEEGGRGGGGGGGGNRYGGRDDRIGGGSDRGDFRRGGGGGGNYGGSDYMGRERDGRMGGGGGMMGGGMNFSMDGRGGGGGGGGGMGPITTQQVSIPADLAGIIIGKNGQRIKQIRIDSGANVELSDPVSGSDRIITITGTVQQIQTAQYMLQTAVKQHLEKRS